MKVSLTTISDVNNFGTHLQIYSLSRVVSEMGHEVELVNYIREHRNIKKQIFFALKRPKVSTARQLYHLLLDSYIRKRMNKFSARHLKYSREYFSLQEMVDSPPAADLYLTGSDQVWNSYHNKGVDRVYYLDFVTDSSKCVSYAASFGMDHVPEGQHKIIAGLLKKYKFIGVRESSALALLSELGREDGVHVLDPTFLLNKKQWEEIGSKKRPAHKYLLVYTVEPDYEKLLVLAREIARSKGLRVCLFNPGINRQFKKDADDVFFFCTPEDFISLFTGAEFIVVSSFHGTAFSLNLNKQFILISPKHYNSRTDSILQLTGLQERSCTLDTFTMEKIATPIDYDLVNVKLDNERLKSLSFLETALITK